ncbi:regulator of G protein signaling 17, 19, putative [Ixodes scapularis]|uniref:Regulator of G protein signaling 17, 19, putative n=1 Tax=Ixodes scapularis TaxID=6945 RepID=B7P3W5_IXOSC|nr:regulator of G protein signaling 17, 19, putative [Ixodes scapularis]|eukprot:XP_002404702.1 regulator of G protein signaling 17, 19, putative [Ixodes scapularis]
MSNTQWGSADTDQHPAARATDSPNGGDGNGDSAPSWAGPSNGSEVMAVPEGDVQQRGDRVSPVVQNNNNSAGSAQQDAGDKQAKTCCFCCLAVKSNNGNARIQASLRKLTETCQAFKVSLDSRVREIINRNMVEPTPHTFDEAQLQIYTLMHRDSYPRFVNSPLFRKLAQLPSPSRKGSAA